MCSRYSLTSPHESVRRVFGYTNEAPFPPRYNIAPTQPAAIVRVSHAGRRELALVRWGLIPSWVKNPAEFSTLINARGESLAAKPSFRAAFRHKRCLVPADGFYEWVGKAGAKRPHLIRPRNGEVMAFAGLFEEWMGSDGSEIDTMAIITVAANKTVNEVYDRMPAILPAAAFDDWLDCKRNEPRHIADLLAPAPEGLLEIVEVSAKLNNPRNEGADLQTPVRTTLF